MVFLVGLWNRYLDGGLQSPNALITCVPKTNYTILFSNILKMILRQISLIDRVDKIYKNTSWRDAADKGDFSDMGFVIKKILVHQEWSPVTTNQVHYNMDRTSWDVRNLLEVRMNACWCYSFFIHLSLIDWLMVVNGIIINISLIFCPI